MQARAMTASPIHSRRPARGGTAVLLSIATFGPPTDPSWRIPRSNLPAEDPGRLSLTHFVSGHVLREGRVATRPVVEPGLYDPSSGEQLHDFNGDIAENGLFWTIPVPDAALTVG